MHFKEDELNRLAFKLLVFTGLRLTHVIYLLNTFDKNKLLLKGNIAKYPISEAGSENKPVFFAYMPRDFVETEMKQVIVDYPYVKNRINYKGINASAIRKWFVNFFADYDAPIEVIRFIIGQIPKTITEEYYLKLERHADRWYSKLVDELKKVLE